LERKTARNKKIAKINVCSRGVKEVGSLGGVVKNFGLEKRDRVPGGKSQQQACRPFRSWKKELLGRGAKNSRTQTQRSQLYGRGQL